MNITDALILAADAMTEHGLSYNDWTATITNSRSVFGRCNYTRRELQFSRILTENATESQFLETLHHEIAHALVGHSHGHGPVWQAKMRELGYAPNRCGEASEAQRVALAKTAKYVITDRVTGDVLAVRDRLVKSRRTRTGIRIYSAPVCRCHNQAVLVNGGEWDQA